MAVSLLRAVTLTAAMLAICAVSYAGGDQGRIDQFLNEFSHETNPVRKAKILERLGNEEFQTVEQAVDSGNLQAALEDLENYIKQLDVTKKALDATGVNAEKKPNGFKELQISVRENLDRLGNLLGNMTRDEQGPFENVRRRLDTIDRSLIRELFPRQPGGTDLAQH
jgi:hypothetical protein